MTSDPPAEGTKTRDVLDAVTPSWQTAHEIGRRVDWSTAPDSCYAYLSILVDRGFVEVDHPRDGLAVYRLTDAGREALRRGQ